jgi:hypothetical protein
MTSMPGLFDDEQFGMDGDGVHEEGYGYDGEAECGENEEEAAGERLMKIFSPPGR